MPTINLYIPVGDQDYYDKFQAIEDKRQWLYRHLDTDIQQEVVVAPTTPNVPRLPEVNVYRWNQHLKDHGFDVGELPNE